MQVLMFDSDWNPQMDLQVWLSTVSHPLKPSSLQQLLFFGFQTSRARCKANNLAHHMQPYCFGGLHSI